MNNNLIRPLKGTANPKEDFVVADIENEENGDVLAIGLSFRDDTEQITHITFSDWRQFTEYLRVHSARSAKFERIWAHNGGGWDWCSYFAWLLKHRKEYDGMELFPIIVGSHYVVIQIDFQVEYVPTELPNGNTVLERKPLYSVKLCDSLYLLRSSLDSLSKKFLGRGKLDISGIMPWDLYRQNRTLFYEYLEKDCENLLLILEKFYSTIREHICPLDRLGATIGSTAFRMYRHNMPVVGKLVSMKDGKIDEKNKLLTIAIPSDSEGHGKLRAILREGYYGGRVEVFKYGEHSGVKVYDINSLYPAVMRDHMYPVNAETIPANPGRYTKGCNGIFRVRFEQPKERGGKVLAPILSIKGKSVYKGEGVFFSPELSLLEKMGGQIEVVEGYIFKHCKPIFREYIQKMWDLRKSDYNGPLGMVCKFLMNSLYGKFCEKPKNSKIMILGGNVWENMNQIYGYAAVENLKRLEKKEKEIRVEIVDEQQGCYMIQDDEAICGNEHVGIGGLITSWARVELYLRFLATGAENLIYCDTDSIHTFGSLPIGKELGEMKLEYAGEAVYCGKKLYALKGNSEYKSKVTAKGVAFCAKREKGNDHKFVLTYSDMVGIWHGGKVLCEFSQPATAKEVLKGKKECTILRKGWDESKGFHRIKHNRKRTLKRT